MSHSYRHTPISGCTNAVSEKAYKKMAHQATRAATRTAMARGNYEIQTPNKCRSIWCGPKDGKLFLTLTSTRSVSASRSTTWWDAHTLSE